MKRLFTVIIFMVVICRVAICQLTLEITPAIQAELDSIPELVLTSASMNTALPYKVDNAQRIWMCPIFNQGSENSCVPSAEIGYTFAYEINRLRNLPSDTITNQYPVDFTYNFLNAGSDNAGTLTTYPWKIVQQIGCPVINSYDPGGNGFIDETVWMTGYEKYHAGNYNKVDTINKIKIWEHFSDLKHWLADHNEGDTSGGLATFTAYTNDTVINTNQIPDDSEENGEWIVSDWGLGNGHQLTIVGYNDSIKFSLNNDTVYRNDFDNNGDSVIDYRDWEIGAFKVANSWGAGWDFSNQGFIYVPYRKVFEIGGLTHSTLVYLVKVYSQYNPNLVLKLKIKNQNRGDLLFKAGCAENSDSAEPSKTHNYMAFSGTGGNFPMLGYSNHNPLETSLDYSDLFKYDTIHIGKVFFQIKQRGYTNGTLDTLVLVDYRWNETIEIPCEMTNFPDTTQHGNNTYWFDYDVLPFLIHPWYTDLDTITTNKVVRKQTVVKSGATLTIESFNNIDFYNSELVIESGATLAVGSNVLFHAKQGTCKITINGNILIGSNVSFIAEPGASLEINFNNIVANISLNHCTLENVKLSSVAASLTINNNSSISNSLIDHKNGNFTLNISSLNTSTVKCTNTGQAGINAIVNITGNTFDQGYVMENSVVTISGYPHYIFDNNTMINKITTVGTYYGLFVTNSGGSSRNNHSIMNNEIYSQQTCMSPQCPSFPIGMGIYSSYATLRQNNVHHNYL